jgi:hypothetical protein
MQAYLKDTLLSISCPKDRPNPGWLTQVLMRFLGKTGGRRGELSSPLINWHLKCLSRKTLSTAVCVRLLEIGNLHLVSFTRFMPLWAVSPLIYQPVVRLDISTTSSSTRRDVLNLQGFLYIVQNFPDIIPDVSEESITDRTESSPLSKVLLIVQVGWFCANSLSRLIQHLP